MRDNKILKIVVLLLFFYNQIIVDVLAVPTHSSPLTPKPNVTVDSQNVLLKNFSIPGEYGSIQKVWNKDWKKEKPWIIHIQDPHADFLAQRNIADIIRTLYFFLRDQEPDRIQKSLLIAVEGTEGDVNSQFFSSFPDAEIRENTAEYYLRKAKFTGPEFLSIIHPDLNIELFGIEDKSLYLRNKDAYVRCAFSRDQWLQWKDSFGKRLEDLELRGLSEEARVFLKRSRDYESQKTGLSEYIQYLYQMSQALNVSFRSFKNLNRLQQLVAMESSLNAEKIEKERTLCFQNLIKKLPEKELKKWIKKNLEYRLGRMDESTYFNSFKEAVGEDLKDYPELGRYIRLVEIKSKLRFQNVSKELGELKDLLADRVFKTEKEKTFRNLLDSYLLIGKMLQLELNRNELRKFRQKKEWMTRILQENGIVLPFSLGDFEEFYEIALAREKYLFEKAINRMKETDRSVAVVVTGGFHSEGLTHYLENHQIAYTVITPKAQRLAQLTEDLYRARMLGYEDSLDKILKTQVRTLHQGSFLKPLTDNDRLNEQITGAMKYAFAMASGSFGTANGKVAGKLLERWRQANQDRYPELREIEFYEKDLVVGNSRIVLVRTRSQALAYRYTPAEEEKAQPVPEGEFLERGLIGKMMLSVTDAQALRPDELTEEARSFLMKHALPAEMWFESGYPLEGLYAHFKGSRFSKIGEGFEVLAFSNGAYVLKVSYQSKFLTRIVRLAQKTTEWGLIFAVNHGLRRWWIFVEPAIRYIMRRWVWGRTVQNEFAAQETLSKYEIASERMNGLMVPFRLVDPTRFSLEVDAVDQSEINLQKDAVFQKAVRQDRFLTPLLTRAVLENRPQEAMRLLEGVIGFQVSMWQRGVVDRDFGHFSDNLILDEDGQIKMIDPGGLSVDEDTARRYVEKRGAIARSIYEDLVLSGKPIPEIIEKWLPFMMSPGHKEVWDLGRTMIRMAYWFRENPVLARNVIQEFYRLVGETFTVGNLEAHWKRGWPDEETKSALKIPGTGLDLAGVPLEYERLELVRGRIRTEDYKDIPFEVVNNFGEGHDQDLAYFDPASKSIKVRLILWDRIRGDRLAQQFLRRHEYIENMLIPKLISEGLLDPSDRFYAHTITSAVESQIHSLEVNPLMKQVIAVMSDAELENIQPVHPNDPYQVFYRAVREEIKNRKYWQLWMEYTNEHRDFDFDTWRLVIKNLPDYKGWALRFGIGDLLRIGKAAGPYAADLFAKGLTTAKTIYGEQLATYWTGLITVVETYRQNANTFFETDIVDMSEALQQNLAVFWPGIIEIVKRGGFGARWLLTSEAEKLVETYGDSWPEYWPKIVQILEGSREFEGLVAQEMLLDLKPLIDSGMPLRQVATDIRGLCSLNEEQARVTLKISIPKILKAYSEAGSLSFYWSGIIRMAKASVKITPWLLMVLAELPKILGKNLAGFWPDLVDLGVMAGPHAKSFFEKVFPRVIEVFGERLPDFWPRIVGMAKWDIKGLSSDLMMRFPEFEKIFSINPHPASFESHLDLMMNVLEKFYQRSPEEQRAEILRSFLEVLDWYQKNLSKEVMIQQALVMIANYSGEAMLENLGRLIQELKNPHPDGSEFAFKIPGTGSVPTALETPSDQVEAVRSHLEVGEYDNIPFQVVEDFGTAHQNDLAKYDVSGGRILVVRRLWEKIQNDQAAQRILRRHEYLENVLIPQLVREGILEIEVGRSLHSLASAVDAAEEGVSVHALMLWTIQIMNDAQLETILPSHPNDPMGLVFEVAQAALRSRKAQGLPQVPEAERPPEGMVNPLDLIIRQQTGLKVIREVGSGAEAVVYEVEDPQGQKLALRVDHHMRAYQNRGTEAVRTRLGHDRHSVIPKIYGTGALYGPGNIPFSTYQIYEYREGTTMDELLFTDFFQRIGPKRSVDILSRVIEGLHFLYRHDVAHGDFGKNQVMVNEAGDVSIVDLGYWQPDTHSLQDYIRGNFQSMRLVMSKVLRASGFNQDTIDVETYRKVEELTGRIQEAFLRWSPDTITEVRPMMAEMRALVPESTGSETVTRPEDVRSHVIVDSRTGRVRLDDLYTAPDLQFDWRYVRHGETYGNQRGIFQGIVDGRENQLTEEGKRQAQRAAELLWDEYGAQIETETAQNIVIVSSPLTRARDTAGAFVRLVKERTGKDLEIVEDPLAIEINFGLWDGKSIEEIKASLGEDQFRAAERYRALDARLTGPDGGENFLRLLDRAGELVRHLNYLYAGKTVIMFSHGTLSSAIRVLMRDPGMFDEQGIVSWRKLLPNAQPFQIKSYQGVGAFKVPGRGPVKAQAPPEASKINTVRENLKASDYKNIPFEVVDQLELGHDDDFAHYNGSRGNIQVLRSLWDAIRNDPEAQRILRRHEYVENLLIPRLVEQKKLQGKDRKRAHALASAVDVLEEGSALHVLMKRIIPLMTNDQLKQIKPNHFNDPKQEFYRAAKEELKRREGFVSGIENLFKARWRWIVGLALALPLVVLVSLKVLMTPVSTPLISVQERNAGEMTTRNASQDPRLQQVIDRVQTVYDRMPDAVRGIQNPGKADVARLLAALQDGRRSVVMTDDPSGIGVSSALGVTPDQILVNYASLMRKSLPALEMKFVHEGSHLEEEQMNHMREYIRLMNDLRSRTPWAEVGERFRTDSAFRENYIRLVRLYWEGEVRATRRELEHLLFVRSSYPESLREAFASDPEIGRQFVTKVRFINRTSSPIQGAWTIDDRRHRLLELDEYGFKGPMAQLFFVLLNYEVEQGRFPRINLETAVRQDPSHYFWEHLSSSEREALLREDSPFMRYLLVSSERPGPFKVPGAGPVRAQAPPEAGKIKTIRENIKASDYENIPFEVVDQLEPGHDDDFAHYDGGRKNIQVLRRLWEAIQKDPEAQRILRRHEYVENILIPSLIAQGVLDQDDGTQAHALASRIDVEIAQTALHPLMKQVIPLMSDVQLRAIHPEHYNDPGKAFYSAVMQELNVREMEERILKITEQVPFEQGERKATLYVNRELLQEYVDQEALKEAIAQMSEVVGWNRSAKENERSVTIALRKPMMRYPYDDNPITHIQIKGVVFDAKEPIVRHQGRGRAKSVKFDPAGQLYIDEYGEDPQGGTWLEKDLQEFLNTEDIRKACENISPLMGIVQTKYSLAWGEFPGLSLDGRRLGFVALGITLEGGAERGVEDRNAYEFQRYGLAVRRLHEAGFIHNFLHPGNISISRDELPVIHDTSDVVRRDSFTPEQDLGYLYKELAYIVAQLDRNYGDEGANYAAQFLRGYFGDQKFQPGSRQIQKFAGIINQMRKGAKISEVQTSNPIFLRLKQEIAGKYRTVAGTDRRGVTTKKVMGEHDLAPQELVALKERIEQSETRKLDQRILERFGIRRILAQRNVPEEYQEEHDQYAEMMISGEERLLAKPMDIQGQMFEKARVELYEVDQGDEKGFRLPQRERPIYEWTEVTTEEDRAVIKIYITKGFLGSNAGRPSIMAQNLVHPLVEIVGGRSHLEAVQHESFYQDNTGERTEAGQGEAVLSDLSKWVIDEAVLEGDTDFLLRMTQPYRLDIEKNAELPIQVRGRAFRLGILVSEKIWEVLLTHQDLIASILRSIKQKYDLVHFIRILAKQDPEGLKDRWLKDIFSNPNLEYSWVESFLQSKLNYDEQRRLLQMYRSRIFQDLDSLGVHVDFSRDLLKDPNLLEYAKSLTRFPAWVSQEHAELGVMGNIHIRVDSAKARFRKVVFEEGTIYVHPSAFELEKDQLFKKLYKAFRKQIQWEAQIVPTRKETYSIQDALKGSSSAQFYRIEGSVINILGGEERLKPFFERLGLGYSFAEFKTRLNEGRIYFALAPGILGEQSSYLVQENILDSEGRVILNKGDLLLNYEKIDSLLTGAALTHDEVEKEKDYLMAFSIILGSVHPMISESPVPGDLSVVTSQLARPVIDGGKMRWLSGEMRSISYDEMIWDIQKGTLEFYSSGHLVRSYDMRNIIGIPGIYQAAVLNWLDFGVRKVKWDSNIGRLRNLQSLNAFLWGPPLSYRQDFKNTIFRDPKGIDHLIFFETSHQMTLTRFVSRVPVHSHSAESWRERFESTGFFDRAA